MSRETGMVFPLEGEPCDVWWDRKNWGEEPDLLSWIEVV